jgi:hypothetical protein
MIDTNIKKFLLRALLAAKGTPLDDDMLKNAVRNAFPQVAHTDGDLSRYIRDLEDAGLTAGTQDALGTSVWLLTDAGKIRAQQLR